MFSVVLVQLVGRRVVAADTWVRIPDTTISFGQVVSDFV